MDVKYFSSMILVAVLIPGTGIAAHCFEDSPSINKGVDPKTNIEVRQITRHEFQDLEQLLNSMIGKWKGTAVEVVCKGSIDAPVEETLEYEVTAKAVRIRPDVTLSLESSWYSPIKKSTRLENLSLNLTPDYLRVNSDKPDGDLELIKVSDTFLVFLKKNIIHNAAGGIVAQEVVRTVAIAGGSLMIEYLTYVNGILVTRSEWELNSP